MLYIKNFLTYFIKSSARYNFLNIFVMHLLLIVRMKTQVLDHNQILRICNRFAFQIVENSTENNELYIIGIQTKGYEIAKILKKHIESISNKKVELSYIKLDKKNPINSIESNFIKNKNVNDIFLIDDVLNTGKTLAFSLSYLLKFQLDSIKTLVLIDRNHKQFPIKVDFKGISLSTSTNEHVSVILDVEKGGIFLR